MMGISPPYRTASGANKCPKCGLYSPEIASRCDCGYDFPSGQMKDSYIKAQHSVRPWVRFWSRHLDIIIFSFVIGFFWDIFMSSLLDLPAFYLGLLVLFVWVFVESDLLSIWGTTPGKWLLRVELKHANGNRPKFSAALKRSFAVWLKGLGLGLPIVSLFTLAVSYGRLTREGTTSWDKDGHFTVTHKKVGVIRTIVAIAIFVGFSVMLALSQVKQGG